MFSPHNWLHMFGFSKLCIGIALERSGMSSKTSISNLDGMVASETVFI